jgi:hypothetical protein
MHLVQAIDGLHAPTMYNTLMIRVRDAGGASIVCLALIRQEFKQGYHFCLHLLRYVPCYTLLLCAVTAFGCSRKHWD